MEYSETRKSGLDAYTLKLLAIVCMALNHYYYIFMGHIPFWQEAICELVGGITFPVMAFMLAQGYRHTRSVRKYMLRLFVFALLTQLPYQYFLLPQLNIMFTLLLGLLGIHALVYVRARLLRVAVIVLILLLALFCDWGPGGVIMILLYHTMYGKRGKIFVPIFAVQTVQTLLYVPLYLQLGMQKEALLNGLFMLGGGALAFLLLHRYNGVQGKKSKYLFYLFYPMHIIVLGVLHLLIFGAP